MLLMFSASALIYAAVLYAVMACRNCINRNLQAQFALAYAHTKLQHRTRY
jgi:hypothetical protein